MEVGGMSKRRTRKQWQALVDEQHQSGLSGAAFCREHGVGYISFCKWRKRLAEAPSDAAEASSAPGFVDVSSLMNNSGATARDWNIVLSLGDGVELRLSRHG
jgi:hypothetical protein